jgi:hypothetical protein
MDHRRCLQIEEMKSRREREEELKGRKRSS